MINGRKKGNNAELEICRKISEWWFDKSFKGRRAEELPFRRTPLSGGWDKKRAAGDIIKPPDCPFCFEIKNREEWSWDYLFKNGSNKWHVMEYYMQAVKAAEVNNEIPVLFSKKNFHPWYVGMGINNIAALINSYQKKILFESVGVGFLFANSLFETKAISIIRKLKK